MKGTHAQYALPLVAAAVLGLAPGLPPLPAHAADGQRVSAAEAQFRAAHPCPATGLIPGPCKGYVIDRIIPQLCGGADAAPNMQWLTLAEAKAKARWDRIGCRGGRKLVLPSESTSTTEAFPMKNAPEPVRSLPLRPGERAPVSPERRRHLPLRPRIARILCFLTSRVPLVAKRTPCFAPANLS